MEKHCGSSLSSWLIVAILLISKLFTPFVPICRQCRFYICYLGEFVKNKTHRFQCSSTNDVIIKRVTIFTVAYHFQKACCSVCKEHGSLFHKLSGADSDCSCVILLSFRILCKAAKQFHSDITIKHIINKMELPFMDYAQFLNQPESIWLR